MNKKHLIISIIVLIVCLISIFAIKQNNKTNERIEITSAVSTTESVTEEKMYSVNITINGEDFSAKFYENDATKELVEKLPLTLNMSDLHENEKYNYLDFSLEAKEENIKSIKNGDIMLYGDNCLVIFYKDFDTSYSYTKLGYIENPENLSLALNGDSISITIKRE